MTAVTAPSHLTRDFIRCFLVAELISWDVPEGLARGVAEPHVHVLYGEDRLPTPAEIIDLAEEALLSNCDICKGNPGVTKVRPWGNPNYMLLTICQKCNDSNALYATS